MFQAQELLGIPAARSRDIPSWWRRKGSEMICPFCRYADLKVVDSRTADDGSSIRRRRECLSCHRRFTTMETTSLSVIKRSGVTESFSREKVMSGVRKACQGRPVTDDQLALLAQQVEDDVRSWGNAVVPANDVGRAILRPLRELDEVAYLRFASVYSSFNSLDDFDQAISELRQDRVERESAATPKGSGTS